MVDESGGAAAVRRLLQSPEFELIPLPSVAKQIEFLPEAATVTVTSSPTRGLEPTLELAAELSRRGFTVVPHLAARSVTDRAHLSRIVQFLDFAGLGRVFIVAGDSKETGEFPDGLSLIRGMKDLGSLPEFGIPAYPDGHPFISDEVLRRVLADKQEDASYMTTQMCFDPSTIADWISQTRSQNITLPLHIGLPGVASLQKLISVSAQIGVGQSARYLSRHTGLFRRLGPQSNFLPDQLIADLIGVITDPAADVQALHLYSFNQIESLEAWRTGWLAALAG
jgi:methylenetetrahydrofolate reductase (NADPH)